MTDLFKLQDKVAIITGASRGIGLAIAKQYIKAGAKVVISSRKQDALDAIAAEIKAEGGEVTAIAAHNGDKAALKNLVAQTIETYGGVDILINNAATNPHFGTLLDAEDSLWHKTLEVNLMGNVWLTQAAVASMRTRGGGKVINIASVNGLRPGAMQGIYSITKAAVINLTQTLAMELAADNIQVNAIAPGLIKTSFAQALWSDETLLSSIQQRTPMNRIGNPDELAGIAIYLGSTASSFTTGQVFIVDGGITIPML